MWDGVENQNVRQHFGGIKALLASRSTEQQSSYLGRRLFGFTRHYMVCVCVGALSPWFRAGRLPSLTPSQIYQYAVEPTCSAKDIWWWVNQPGSQSHKIDLLRLTIEAASLRHELNCFLDSHEQSPSTVVEVWRIFERARSIAQQFDLWARKANAFLVRQVDHVVPDGAVAEGGSSSSSSSGDDARRAEALPGDVYTFNNVCAGQAYFEIHIRRLGLAEVMKRALSWIRDVDGMGALSSATTKGLDEASRLGQAELAHAVACIPYLCGSKDHRGASPWVAINCSWLLYLAALSPFASAQQSQYLVGRLEQFSRHWDIKVGYTLARVSTRVLLVRHWWWRRGSGWLTGFSASQELSKGLASDGAPPAPSPRETPDPHQSFARDPMVSPCAVVPLAGM